MKIAIFEQLITHFKFKSLLKKCKLSSVDAHNQIDTFEYKGKYYSMSKFNVLRVNDLVSSSLSNTQLNDIKQDSILKDTTKNKIHCPCCSTNVIYNNHESPHNIDIHATCEALIKRCNSGEMKVIRGDCPLEMMEDLLYTDTVYTIVQFILCNVCGRVIFWGLCIRGAPVYKEVEESEIERWQWEDIRKYWLKS